MAREYAQNRIAMWNDDDFRRLSSDAQNLYSYLLAHPSTTYAGVTDWRPARLQAVNTTWDAAQVEEIGRELEAGFYIVIDRDTEEAAIRSFLRWETMLRNPNLTRATVKAFNQIQSRLIRGVVAFEVHRLRDEFGGKWAGFDVDEMADIYETEGVNAKAEAPIQAPRSDPSLDRPSDPWADRPSEASSEVGTVWAITNNKKQITDNRKPEPSEQSTRAESAGTEEGIEQLCRRQLRDVLHVDFVKVQTQLAKACGRIPTPTDVVRVSAAILERASEAPKQPTAFVVAAVKNDWPEWQQLMDEGVA